MNEVVTQEKMKNQPAFDAIFLSRQPRPRCKVPPFPDVSGTNSIPNFRVLLAAVYTKISSNSVTAAKGSRII